MNAREAIRSMTTRGKVCLLGGAVTGLALLALTGGSVSAPAAAKPAPSETTSGEAPAQEAPAQEQMMSGGMMGGDMMDQGGTSGGQMQMMGTFDEDEPFDLQFIDQMIMHHTGAIMSSQNMIADSERPELRELAEDIERSQSEQIAQMQEMRERWYPEAERTFGMMDPTQMQEMMGEGQMQQMMGGSMQQMMGGDTTDAMFLRMMVPHHQMAVDMSERALDGEAENPELEELAEVIRDEQAAEIELMNGYLEEIEQTTGN